MAAVKLTGKTTAKSGLRIHPVPVVQSSTLSLYSYGSPVSITESEKDKTMTMYKTDKGWIAADYVEITGGESKKTVTPQPGPTVEAAQSQNIDGDFKQYYQASILDITAEEKYRSEVEKLYSQVNQGSLGQLKKYNLVHGLPFQFNSITDRRYGNNGSQDEYGRTFAREIIANSPIAIFTPGIPKFLTGWTVGNAQREQMLTLLRKTENENGLGEETLDKLLSEIGTKQMEYFSFQAAYVEYMEYVNTLCRSSAILMGIGDETLDGKPLRFFDWKAANADPTRTKTLQEVIGLDDAVAFAYEPLSGISDSMSSNTSESQLAGKLKGASDAAREAEFLFGAGAGVELAYASDSNIEQLIPKFNDMTKYNPNSMLSRIGMYGKTVATGANVRFPEIWRDSSYAKSYSIDLRFASPYGDAYSKWRYVLVPFWHVFALGGPRSVTPNTYQSPFLIRAFSKGYFNCELGMIDSITFKKFGDGDSISEDGIPTEIEISVSFKDLYTALALTKFKHTSLFFNNSGLIDLIGTTSGVNINRNSVLNKMNLWINSKQNTLIDFPGNFMSRTQEYIRNKMRPIVGE